MHLVDSAKHENTAINELYGKLKMKCFKIPNAPNSNRYRSNLLSNSSKDN